jgi:hypothetical protein
LFTRWVELIPIKTVDGATAGKEVLKHLCRYGTPMSIVSDNGTQFINAMIKELFAVAGIEHTRITAYSHEENGLVERSNKETERHLLMLVNERRQKDCWSDLVPLVQRIYNTSDCANIGASPATLMFKRLNIDRRITEKPIDGAGDNVTLSKWLDGFLGVQEAMIKKAKEIQRAANLLCASRGYRAANAFDPKPNDLLLLDDPAGKEDKLTLPLTGPYKCETVEGNAIGLKHLIWNTPRKVHKSRVRPFFYNPRRTNPREVAMKDMQEFEVEKILEIDGLESAGRANIRVKVRWMGYGREYDSWVPWKSVNQNSILHDYLRKRNLHRLLPASQRREVSRK